MGATSHGRWRFGWGRRSWGLGHVPGARWFFVFVFVFAFVFKELAFKELAFKELAFKELAFKELTSKELDVFGYFDLLGLGVFDYFCLLGLGVFGYFDLLGLGRLFRSIGIGRSQGDYSKEWHLVPELRYLNYGI